MFHLETRADFTLFTTLVVSEGVRAFRNPDKQSISEHPSIYYQIAEIEKVLEEIGAAGLSMVFVLNKSNRCLANMPFWLKGIAGILHLYTSLKKFP